MERIKEIHDVFIFESIEDVQVAIDQINNAQGLPTEECLSYATHDVIDGKIVLIKDDVIVSVLGDGWESIEVIHDLFPKS